METISVIKSNFAISDKEYLFGPCLQSMPHFDQKVYGYHDLQINVHNIDKIRAKGQIE